MDTDVRKRNIMLWYTIAAVVGVLAAQALWTSNSQVDTIPYSRFEELLNEGKIAEVRSRPKTHHCRTSPSSPPHDNK